ncbi:hypothetical protein F5Y14DRAFT_451353 [Nemania sp. NC0429]|nr:hypothetical protein F5Y14DRAFT_451353 [Nemania sp. NC0429]
MSLPSGAGVDLCSISSKPTSDLKSNFVDPPSLQPAAFAIGIFGAVLILVTASGRFHANRKALKASDYFMFIAIIINLGATVAVLLISRTFRHPQDIPLCWITIDYAKESIATSILSTPIVFFTRVSILLFYLQVFSVDQVVRTGSWIGIFAAVIFFVPLTVADIYFEVPHLGETWVSPAYLARTHRGLPIAIVIGVVSVVVDIYLFVLPLRTISHLNLSPKRRLQMQGLFGTAILGIIAGVISLVYRVKIVSGDIEGWTLGSVEISSMVENNVAIFVGCLPGFTKFFRSSVMETTWFKSIYSKLGRSKMSTAASPLSGDGLGQNHIWTYGSPKRAGPRYHELSEVSNVDTRVSAVGDVMPAAYQSNSGIVRTVGLTQSMHSEGPVGRAI